MLSLFGWQQARAEMSQIYVIPIEGEVGPAMAEFVSQSIKEAEENNAEAIIFNINTPGGQVDSAITISEAILNTFLRTIAYVNGEAISAGTIITISAEDIYMSPSSTIGAAETRPNEEKYISYWAGKLRNVAQIRGRDPVLIASMADADIEIEGVIEKGKLLTLTSQEAIELELIDGVENSIEEVQNTSDLQKHLLYELTPSFQLRLASMATSTMATSILLTLGFIGAVIEIITPGFGLGGVISLTAFGLYFGGVLLAGFSSWIVLVIFIVGLILLLVEVIAPGFGVPGILGIVAIFASIILASTSMEQALISLLIAIILTIIAVILLFKYAPRNNKFFDKITLSTSLNTSSGYVSSEDYKSYVGKIGVTITPLRPAGSIEVESRKLDVVSENAYIEKDDKVKIIKVEGNRIIVRKLD
jgi:membrane-bound serine protease (ClpP class)